MSDSPSGGGGGALSFLSRFGFPFTQSIAISSAPHRGAPTKPDEAGSYAGGKALDGFDGADPTVAFGVQVGLTPRRLLAVLCYVYTVDFEAAAAEGFTLRPGGWCARIVLRDVALMLLYAGLWDWVLLHSPFAATARGWKYNKDAPSDEQTRRDVFWSTSSTLLSSAQEIALILWWLQAWGPPPPFFAAEGEATLFSVLGVGVGVRTVLLLIWSATVKYWRLVHFYIIHRGMHPWWDRKNGLAQLDVGAFLYRHVHSLHLKSYNPTAWIGISVHPLESTAYFSAALIPLAFASGQHPYVCTF